MCHLCRKIECLGGLEYKATKPIFLLISKLHKHVKPRLGDLWLWRHDETTKLRGRLAKLYKSVPLLALKAILEEVDKEIIHIKKNMPEHPPLHSTGRLGALKAPITPDESSSIRWQRENLQGSDGSKRNKARFNIILDKSNLEGTNLEGSDIDPPSTRIQQSIQIVEDWFRKCNELVSLSNNKDTDDISLVSEVFGGIRERPKLDAAAVWKYFSWKHLQGMRFSRSSQDEKPTSFDNTRGSQSDRSSRNQKYNCIYAEASNKLDLDIGIVERVAKISSTTFTRKPTYDLGTLLRHKQVEKLSKRRDISITEAIEMLQARNRRDEQKYSMSGGRSPGLSARTFSEAIVSASQPRGSIESSATDSASVTASEVRKCLDVIIDQARGNEDSNLSSPPIRLSSIEGMEGQSIVNRSHSARQTENKGRSGFDAAGRNPNLADLKITTKAQNSAQNETEEISEAVRRSRRRRAERATSSVPFTDRYRHDERGKAWAKKDQVE